MTPKLTYILISISPRHLPATRPYELPCLSSVPRATLSPLRQSLMVVATFAIPAINFQVSPHLARLDDVQNLSHAAQREGQGRMMATIARSATEWRTSSCRCPSSSPCQVVLAPSPDWSATRWRIGAAGRGAEKPHGKSPQTPHLRRSSLALASAWLFAAVLARPWMSLHKLFCQPMFGCPLIRFLTANTTTTVKEQEDQLGKLGLQRQAGEFFLRILATPCITMARDGNSQNIHRERNVTCSAAHRRENWLAASCFPVYKCRLGFKRLWWKEPARQAWVRCYVEMFWGTWRVQLLSPCCIAYPALTPIIPAYQDPPRSQANCLVSSTRQLQPLSYRGKCFTIADCRMRRRRVESQLHLWRLRPSMFTSHKVGKQASAHGQMPCCKGRLYQK